MMAMGSDNKKMNCDCCVTMCVDAYTVCDYTSALILV